MNPNDSLLLAALLDGELDPESSVRAEALARSDPSAAEFLAETARVGDAVASLPRAKLGVDLSPAIVAHLRQRRRVGHLRLAAMTTVAAGMAASALVMFHAGGGGHVPNGAGAVAVVTEPPEKPPAVRRVHAAPVPLASLARLMPIARPVASVPKVGEAIRPAVLAAETKARDDRASLRTLVASKEAHRVDLVVDELAPAIEALDAVVGASPRVRPEHAKVHLVHGVDPKRPGKACVYVLVMDVYEYAAFRRNLGDRFEGVLTGPEPIGGDLVASLGTVGRIEIEKGGESIALLKPIPAEAEKTIASRAPEMDKGREVLVDEKGMPVRVLPKADDRLAPAPARIKKVDPADAKPAVYLVYLTPRDRGRR